MTDRTVLGYGDTGAAKQMQDRRAQDIVERALAAFAQKQAYRVNHAQQWEEAASLISPWHRNTFFYGNYTFPGIKKTQLQVDATGMLANAKFAAICDSMMTPFSSSWHVLEATDPNVQKDRQVRLWLEKLSNKLADARYHPMAGFRRQNQAIYLSVGAFGNGFLFIDQLCDMRGKPIKGNRYRAVPLGEMFIGENHQGIVDNFDRWFRLTPRQAFGQFGDAIGDQLKTAMEKQSEAPFDFLHEVCPNQEYEPERADSAGMLWSSCYISLTTKTLLKEGGYRSFPVAPCRYDIRAGTPYSDGPAQVVLPALKTLNAEKTTFLTQGHRAGAGVYLSADDGAQSFSLKPGAINPGTVSADGKPLVVPIEFGKIQVTKEMMDEERGIIGEAFFTTIFSSLVENPNMTATQVVELINQKGIYLAPMAGTMAPEYLGSAIDREIDLMMGQDYELRTSMPPLLREAHGEYKVVYTSPLFKAARAGDAAGFMRTLESALQVAGQTGDPSHVDQFAFNRAWPAIAAIQNVPESWMSSEDEIAAIRKGRAQQQQQQAQIQALPAQAAMMKAKAAVQKAGGQTADQMQQAA